MFAQERTASKDRPVKGAPKTGAAQRPPRAGSAEKSSEAVDKKLESARWNNLGVAYLGQQKLPEALAAFEKAHAADPDAIVPEENRAITMVNLQRNDEAEKLLLTLAERDPRLPRVWYNLGLLCKSTGQADKSVDAFRKVTEIDPHDADAFYFLGDAESSRQGYKAAIAAFEKALEVNPAHVSAEFGLARAEQHTGNTEEAKKHLERFQKLVHDKAGAPISQVYGEQGQYSLAQMEEGPPPVPAAIKVHFADSTVQSGFGAQHAGDEAKVGAGANRASAAGICIFDYDGDGLPDVFLANAEHGAALYRNLGNGRFEDVTKQAGLAEVGPAFSCNAGDYDNDTKPDLALFNGQVHVFHNDGGKFKDVTQSLGISSKMERATLMWVDYDHDGDLDLLVTDASAGAGKQQSGKQQSGNQLWRNNGNNTFTDVTAQEGFAGTSETMGAIAADLNNDRAIDLVTTSSSTPPTFHANPREGAFPATQPWPIAGGTNGVAVLDFDKDGNTDVAFTQDSAPGVSLWRNLGGGRFAPVPLPKTGFTRAWGIAAIDYDNDGWIDLAVAGETAHGSELRLFRNKGPEGFEDVTAAVGLDRVHLSGVGNALVAFDYDRDGAADLLATTADGVTVLRNEGGTQNNSLRIALRGLADNRSAFGAKVQVFAGQEHQKWETTATSGYLSQGPPEILAGLARLKQADVVRILWPTGVLQDEIEMAAGKTQNILEIDRRGSSCPVLFAWDGARFKMVSDVIGPAVIGHWVGPNERDVPDPDEYIKVDGNRVKTVDGHLRFTFAEPMEEVNYLDQVKLLAVDHPKDEEVYPNERFVANPPFPAFKVIASRGAHLPLEARDDQGRDVLPELRARDHKYVAGFGLLPFAGFAKPHSLELDIGPWDDSHPLRLLMHGFTEYFMANSMYAAYQAGVKVVVPFVDALDANGKWVRVTDDLGFPAGLPRTMVADLTGKLPHGTRRIRITTNLRVYWDQILVDNSGPLESTVHELPLAKAKIHFHGYPRSTEKRFPGDLDYDYDDVSATGPYARHVGMYTRYGDVTPLLTAVDDRFVIFGSGEEVVMDFDPANLPPLPHGWTRDYFFYANGFVKDMDFYEADAATVGPMPFHAMKDYPYPAEQDYPESRSNVQYQLDYNSRYQSGKGVSSYRAVYPR